VNLNDLESADDLADALLLWQTRAAFFTSALPSYFLIQLNIDPPASPPYDLDFAEITDAPSLASLELIRAQCLIVCAAQIKQITTNLASLGVTIPGP
jgi:hypothetical protein